MTESDNLEKMEKRAVELEQLNRFSSAERTREQIVELTQDPEKRVLAVAKLAHNLFEQGKYWKAIYHCQRTLELCADRAVCAAAQHVILLEFMARSYERLMHPASAAAYFSEALSICDRELSGDSLSAKLCLEHLAENLWKAEHYKQAVPVLGRYIELLRENSLNNVQQFADLLHRYAVCQLKQNCLNAARNVLKEEIGLRLKQDKSGKDCTNNRHLVVAYLLLSRIYVRLEDIDAAKREAKKAVKAGLPTLGTQHKEFAEALEFFLSFHRNEDNSFQEID